MLQKWALLQLASDSWGNQCFQVYQIVTNKNWKKYNGHKKIGLSIYYFCMKSLEYTYIQCF